MGLPPSNISQQVEIIRSLSESFEVEDLLETSFTRFVEALAGDLKAQFSGRPTLDLAGIAVALSVCTLTRELKWDERMASDQINSVHKWLMQVPAAPEDDADRLKRAQECAIAWGLGAHRELRTGPDAGFGGVWPGARDWARQQISNAVGKGMRLLGRLVPELIPKKIKLEDARDAADPPPGAEELQPGEREKRRSASEFSDLLPSEFEIVSELLNWLVRPSLADELEGGEAIKFLNHSGWLEISRTQDRSHPLLEGQRRTYRLTDDVAEILVPRLPPGVHIHPVVGSQLAVRKGDFANAALRLLYPPNPKATRPEVVQAVKKLGGMVDPKSERIYFDWDLYIFEFGTLTARKPCRFEEFSCTCGRDTCSIRHRIGSFDPVYSTPKMTLKSWIHTAVNGMSPSLTPRSFKEGMLYAWLAQGWHGYRIREVPLLRERVMNSPDGESRCFCDTVDGLVLTGNEMRGKPARLKRCTSRLSEVFVKQWRGHQRPNQSDGEYLRCGSLTVENTEKCEFCGGTRFGPDLVTVWQHHGRDAKTLEAIERIVADPAPNPLEKMLLKEQKQRNSDDVGQQDAEVDENEDS